MESITLAEAGLDPDAIDGNVDPCDDLYRHACGRWVSTFEIPADKVTYEKTYTRAADEMALRLRAILEETPPPDASEGRRALHHFYSSCVDEERLSERGLAPIEPYLKRIRAAKTRVELASALGEVHPIIDAFFTFGTEADQDRPPKVRAWLGTGGIRGTNADVLTSDAAEDKALRAAFQARLRELLELGAMPAREADTIVTSSTKVHTSLARAMKEAWAQKGDRSALVDEAKLLREAPGFPWKAFFDAAGLDRTGAIRVADLPFLRAMAVEYQKLGLDDLKAYLVTRVVLDTSHVLDERYREARWREAKKEWGEHALEPRW
ncbi:MAG: hypothetical protein HOV80_38355, partial [Polyangiaceae bacterium]|nr:hypothetical protein [Polyangiaceae bacterium]